MFGTYHQERLLQQILSHPPNPILPRHKLELSVTLFQEVEAKREQQDRAVEMCVFP